MIVATGARVTTEIARQSKLSQEIAQGQIDVSSLKRIHVASDDPPSAARIADLRRTQANEAQWAANVEDGSATATRADAALTSTGTAIDRARELVILVKNGTVSADQRSAVSAELLSLADGIADTATTTDGRGRPLFPTGQPVQLPIADGVTLQATVSRDEVFGDLAEMLRNAAAAAANGDTSGAQGTLDRLNAATSTLAAVRAAQGTRVSRFEAARDALASTGVDLAEERSGLEDTDLASTVAAIQSKLLTLNVAQSVFAKINARTLFDLL